MYFLSLKKDGSKDVFSEKINVNLQIKFEITCNINRLWNSTEYWK